MVIDKNGKLFGKVSIIDIIIVFVILGVIGGAIYKFSVSNTATPFAIKDEFYIEFYCDEGPDFAINSIQVGDIATNYENGNTFGEVISITTDEVQRPTETNTGEYVISPKPGYLSAKINIKTNGFIKEQGGVLIDNVDYYIGRTIILRAGKAVISARVFNVSDN